MITAGLGEEVGGARGAVTHALPPSQSIHSSLSVACALGFLSISFFRERRGRVKSYHGNSKLAASYLFAGLQRGWAKQRLRDVSLSFFVFLFLINTLLYVRNTTKKRKKMSVVIRRVSEAPFRCVYICCQKPFEEAQMRCSSISTDAFTVVLFLIKSPAAGNTGESTRNVFIHHGN